MKSTLAVFLTCLLLSGQLFAQCSYGPIVGYGYANGAASVNGIHLPTSKLKTMVGLL